MHTLKFHMRETELISGIGTTYIAIEWRSKGHTSIITFVIMIVAGGRYTQPEWEQNFFYWVLYVACRWCTYFYMAVLALGNRSISPYYVQMCIATIACIYTMEKLKIVRRCEWMRALNVDVFEIILCGWCFYWGISYWYLLVCLHSHKRASVKRIQNYACIFFSVALIVDVAFVQNLTLNRMNDLGRLISLSLSQWSPCDSQNAFNRTLCLYCGLPL